jgi:hypothetical protein
MSCIAANTTCEYIPITVHGHAGNVSSGNGSSDGNNNTHINDLCEGHDDFCLTRLKCAPGGSPCNAFPSLNYTGKNDTATGKYLVTVIVQFNICVFINESLFLAPCNGR